jgi:hypothetical protein
MARNKGNVVAQQARYRASHKVQLRLLNKNWYAANQDHVKNYRLLKLYGLTLADYNCLKAKQNNACAICNQVPTLLYVDHDHKTGKVRGLLCNLCNVAIGQLGESEARLLSAVDYLRR